MTKTEWDQAVLSYPLFEGDFGESGDRVLRDHLCKAAKEHECYHCGGPIALNERHRVHVGVYGGELKTYRYCSACCDAMAVCFTEGPEPLERRFCMHRRLWMEMLERQGKL